MILRPIDLPLTPEAVLRRWPPSRPLAALWSGGQGPRSRWTVLAEPEGDPVTPDPASANDPASTLRAMTSAMASSCNPSTHSGADDRPPFVGGWIGYVCYELGRNLEPTVARSSRHACDSSAWPTARFVRCNSALAFDHLQHRWWSIGDGESCARDLVPAHSVVARPMSLNPLSSETGRDRFLQSVERALEYIRAGDVYQVNLAHRLTGAFEGSCRALFAALTTAARPWYGGYLELPPEPSGSERRALLSLSPELFLQFDAADGSVLTRPMKGTRPGTGSPEELRNAPKDNAELAMIVDLMRNDLGRVCEFGSVRVEEPRVIERHGERAGANPGGVLQAVAEVHGKMRARLGLADLLAAMLPGGSVTGAPKVRAMQIIDELEPVPRGPYCGCFGYASDDGHAAFNIAIRTALVQGRPGSAGLDEITAGTVNYSVGAGIVADSDPEAEWRETLDKAGILRGVTRIEDKREGG